MTTTRLFGMAAGTLLAGAAMAAEPGERSPISEFRLAPERIVWQTEAGVAHAETLLAAQAGQPVLQAPLPPCTLTAAEGRPAGVLLDFGREIQGSVELFTPMAPDKKPVRVRVRFGESAAEAMAELGERHAGNDHAVRDEVVTLPWLGTKRVGPSGFRFLRIDAVDPGRPARLTQVRAVLGIRDLPRPGAFRCSDERLGRIWEVGADTVHLCMQDYLWDGIKRDRLVWIGDMHPEVATIHAVFGSNEVVPKSLDLTRDVTPVTQWMNGISSYSMWWVLIHEDLWMHQGDRGYLAAQQPYLGTLLERLAGLVGPDGRERIDGMRFLDWPSSPNKQGVTAGLQGLLVMALESGARLMDVLGDERVATLCREAAGRGRKVVPEANGSKSGAALLVLAGMRDPAATARDTLLPDGARGVSTFYGLYVLEALAAAGEIDAALEILRTYWGGMLDLGATTFWEDFNLEWTENAARIDELVPPGKKDIHGDCGAYCYEGFRHSLCHGWASGPTSWLSRHVLGITPAEPGFTRVRIAPRLGSLAWAEGSYPTPKGPIRVRHDRQPDGSLRSSVTAPEDVAVDLVGTSLAEVGGSGSFAHAGDDVQVAAYYFPNWGPLETSEWGLIKWAKPQFEDHLQPKVPAWGFENENDPAVMARKIEAAASHGIDAFIFDWYFFDPQPEAKQAGYTPWDGQKYLSRALEQGFLEAPNNREIKFAILWCNHDVGPAKGAVTPATFETLAEYVTATYFPHPSYWKLAGKPYFSIYNTKKFLESFGNDLDAAAAALDRFRERARAAGFPGLHVNAVLYGVPRETRDEVIRRLGFDSTTSYVWIHHAPLADFPATDYAKAANAYFRAVNRGGGYNGLDRPAASLPVPYHPNVSMGWDSSPRCRNAPDWATRRGYPFGAVMVNNTPAAFRAALERARPLAEANPPGQRVVTINSWNEWGEGSYVEPDTTHGMGYLEAIRDVFGPSAGR